MTAYDPRVAELSREITPWLTVDFETLSFKLRDDAPADIVEKNELLHKLYDELVNGFPIGCQ